MVLVCILLDDIASHVMAVLDARQFTNGMKFQVELFSFSIIKFYLFIHLFICLFINI